MNNSNVTILVEAKQEYTKQLINILKKSIYTGIKGIYKKSHDECKKNKTLDKILITFQTNLSKIPKWDENKIISEYNSISESTKCDWIDDLLTAVFITHTKILTMVHRGEQDKKINLKIPKSSHFIHLCYIETAREFWKNPYLFSEKVSQFDYQRNMRDAETIIGESILETIRKQLPVKHILREYLGDSYQSDVEEDVDIQSDSSPKHLKNIQSMIKKEINQQNEDLNVDNDNQLKTLIKDEVAKQISEPFANNNNEKEDTPENLSDGLIIEKMETTNLNDLLIDEDNLEKEQIKEISTIKTEQNNSGEKKVENKVDEVVALENNDIINDDKNIKQIIVNNMEEENNDDDEGTQEQLNDDVDEKNDDEGTPEQLNDDVDEKKDDHIENDIDNSDDDLDDIDSDDLDDTDLDDIDSDDLDDTDLDDSDLDNTDSDDSDLDKNDDDDDNDDKSDTMSITDIDDINIDLDEFNELDDDVNNIDLNDLSESNANSQVMNSEPKEFSFYD